MMRQLILEGDEPCTYPAVTVDLVEGCYILTCLHDSRNIHSSHLQTNGVSDTVWRPGSTRVYDLGIHVYMLAPLTF